MPYQWVLDQALLIPGLGTTFLWPQFPYKRMGVRFHGSFRLLPVQRVILVFGGILGKWTCIMTNRGLKSIILLLHLINRGLVIKSLLLSYTVIFMCKKFDFSLWSRISLSIFAWACLRVNVRLACYSQEHRLRERESEVRQASKGLITKGIGCLAKELTPNNDHLSSGAEEGQGKNSALERLITSK